MPKLRGATLFQRREHFRKEFDNLRRTLLWEPRGHRDMFGAILTEPTDDADLAAFFLDAGGYVNMCVHGSIGVLTAALELGLVAARGTRGRYTLETPAGIIPLIAKFRNGKAEEITVRNVPSFLWSADTPLNFPRVGKLHVDVAYAGNWFVLVSAGQLGIDLERTPLTVVLDLGRRLLIEARRQILVDASVGPPPHEVALVQIYADRPQAGKTHRNLVIFGNGQFDRSPCGTGTSARMAALYARGELDLNELFLSQSVTGCVFKGKLRSETMLGDRVAVVPEITGSAWITGVTQVVLDPNDPLTKGFLAEMD
jgi:proline racemase/trans-L-3-hydroxyproline dehydratase